MPDRPGLDGLKKALGFRVYANINVQSIVDDGPDSFIFQMNDCRVQSARKRKGMDDYPANPRGLWNTPISPGLLMTAFKPNASGARRTAIRMTGSARGGFSCKPLPVHELRNGTNNALR